MSRGRISAARLSFLGFDESKRAIGVDSTGRRCACVRASLLMLSGLSPHALSLLSNSHPDRLGPPPLLVSSPARSLASPFARWPHSPTLALPGSPSLSPLQQQLPVRATRNALHPFSFLRHSRPLASPTHHERNELPPASLPGRHHSDRPSASFQPPFDKSGQRPWRVASPQWPPTTITTTTLLTTPTPPPTAPAPKEATRPQPKPAQITTNIRHHSRGLTHRRTTPLPP